MSTHPQISIALCTYNGEKYLKEQLDSFVQQTLSPYELVVCDDCSSDSTTDILEAFAWTAPFPVRIYHNEYTLGLIKNFSKAAGLCRGEYVAFSDQDDIWLPDKLDACFQAMGRAECKYGKDVPLLVHSDLSIIDNDNRVIASSWMKVKHLRPVEVDPLKNLLVMNYISGCTSLCNKILIKNSLPFPDVIMNHDGWVALIAASHGKIIFIPEPKVLYRQHPSNASGRALYWYDVRDLNPKHILNNLIPMAIGLLARVLYQAKVLQEHLASISCGVPPILNCYIDALERGGLLNSFRVMFILKVRQQGFFPNILDFYVITRRIHLKYINGINYKSHKVQ